VASKPPPAAADDDFLNGDDWGDIGDGAGTGDKLDTDADLDDLLGDD
jgi:hypothetical protein